MDTKTETRPIVTWSYGDSAICEHGDLCDPCEASNLWQVQVLLFAPDRETAEDIGGLFDATWEYPNDGTPHLVSYVEPDLDVGDYLQRQGVDDRETG